MAAKHASLELNEALSQTTQAKTVDVSLVLGSDREQVIAVQPLVSFNELDEFRSTKG